MSNSHHASAHIPDEAVQAFIERYELGCNHRYDENSIRAALTAALPHLSAPCVVTKPVDVTAVRRQAHEEAAELLDQGFDMPVEKAWRNDGQPSKNDKCPHDKFMYEDCMICASAAIRALSAEPAQGEQWQPTHRHVKRGTEYQRLGDAQVQCEDGLTDYELATVYVGSDGGLWVRRKSEFEDGRFAPLPAAPITEAGK